MADNPTVAAARSFLKLILDEAPPSDEGLARALDELAVAYHNAPEGSVAKASPEPPNGDPKLRYSVLSQRFPSHGLYTAADPNSAAGTGSLVGDAIDDLADITRDLDEVVWISENASAEDAHWHFKFTYRTHWGQHLRELSLYLHAKIW